MPNYLSLWSHLICFILHISSKPVSLPFSAVVLLFLKVLLLVSNSRTRWSTWTAYNSACHVYCMLATVFKPHSTNLKLLLSYLYTCVWELKPLFVSYALNNETLMFVLSLRSFTLLITCIVFVIWCLCITFKKKGVFITFSTHFYEATLIFLIASFVDKSTDFQLESKINIHLLW